MKKIVTGAVILAIAATLSGCGNTRLDRAVSGAGIGAGGGAVIGAIAGAPIAGAALIGAAAGGAVGAISDKHQINLGKAWWEH